MINKWDMRMLDLAKLVASWSKDPSRHVGAVIARPDHSIVSVGYNGFARGVEDKPERYNEKAVKYELVVHAEMNAILAAKEPLTNCVLYCTLMPCSRCAAGIINSGIKKVVWRESNYEKDPKKIDIHNFDLTLTQFEEAGIDVVTYHNSISEPDHGTGYDRMQLTEIASMKIGDYYEQNGTNSAPSAPKNIRKI